MLQSTSLFFFFTCALSFYQSPFSILPSLSLPVSKRRASWVVMEVAQIQFNPKGYKRLALFLHDPGNMSSLSKNFLTET